MNTPNFLHRLALRLRLLFGSGWKPRKIEDDEVTLYGIHTKDADGEPMHILLGRRRRDQ